ncbi:MarR family transcriptional regulator [Streptohalobacillus salinus]|uniref:MarR family transcriptional regulator n=1 Tax=Streptohalobacillus salinus TaxID=621096 RepID=A0A2V3WQJ7_9BACI|nr:MarR family transcriptional regulator [Streptohalobacillus salinus]PXW90969.1 MarR family transcriptional regulator [Streptohalobacillus salinus]
MPDDIILYIRFVHFALEREKKSLFETHNLTASQGDILLFLGHAHHHQNALNQKNIEEHFHLTNPTVTGLLKRLEEKGFIERVKSETDARNKIIHLTDQSFNVLKKFFEHKQEMEKKLFRGMSEEKKEVVLGYLKEILANLNQDHDVCKK